MITCWHVVRLNQQAFALHPRRETTFECFCARTCVAQPGGSTLGQLLATLANHNNKLTGVLVGPGRCGAVVAPDARWQHTRIRGVIGVNANVDYHRRFWCTDETGKLRDIDGVGRGHGRPFLSRGSETRYLGRSLTG